MDTGKGGLEKGSERHRGKFRNKTRKIQNDFPRSVGEGDPKSEKVNQRLFNMYTKFLYNWKWLRTHSEPELREDWNKIIYGELVLHRCTLCTSR